MVHCTTLEVRSVPKFIRLAKKNMTADCLQELIDALYLDPKQGVVIPGCAGIRKIRWTTGMNSKGKRSGVRVLYYYEEGVVVLLLTLYRKADKSSVSPEEKKHLLRLLAELLEEKNNVEIR